LVSSPNFFTAEKVREALAQSKRASVRERELPAYVVVCYVIALALYMRSLCREALRGLLFEGRFCSSPSYSIWLSGMSRATMNNSVPHGHFKGAGQ
jgi:hypothetical protein